jgi:predicted thioesterase
VVDATMTDSGHATGPDGGMPAMFGTLAIGAAIADLARTLLHEHLEEDELAVPGRLEIIHRTPVPVGTAVQLEATVQMVEPTRVTCEVLVRTSAGVAARASYEQEVVARTEWLSRLGIVVR